MKGTFLGNQRTWFFLAVLCLFASCAGQNKSQPTEATHEWKKLGPTSIPDGGFDELYAKAKEGNAEAAYEVYLAIVFRRNKAPEGVEPSELLKQAAEAGVLEAQCSYYSYLMRSPATRKGAVKWLELAAKKGFKPAVDRLESHEELMELYNQP